MRLIFCFVIFASFQLFAEHRAGIHVEMQPANAEVGSSQHKEKVSKQIMDYVMGELNYENVAMVDVDPKAFDYDPDKEENTHDQSNPDLAGIKFLSLLLYPNENSDFALLDPEDRFEGTMYFIPGSRIEVEGKIQDYERAPVSIVTQDGRAIIANYPRENVLPQVENPVFISTQRGFFIDKRPVSKRDYQQFIKETKRPPPRGWDSKNLTDDPVVNVTYDDAASYAAWAGKRLPRYSEYERALRKYPQLRLSSPQREWTSTIANPGISPELLFLYGGTPALKTTADSFTGFRCATDAR